MKKEILLLFCMFFLCAISNAQSTFVKTLGGTGDEYANSAIKTKDGNFLVIGSTSSFGSGGRDAYVSKVNSSAKEIWDKAIGGADDDEFLSGIQLVSGDFILVGRTSEFGGNGDVLVTRLDNFGGVIWSKIYYSSNYDEGNKVIEASDGNILIGGNSYLATGGINILIIKISQNGDEIWNRSYNTNGAAAFESVGLIEDSFGNYLISGEWLIGTNTDDTEGAILSLNANGDFVSLNSYDSNSYMNFNSVLLEHSSGFLNLGRIFSSNGSTRELLMTSLSYQNDVNWSKAIGVLDEYVIPTSARILENGNYIISAYETEGNPAINPQGMLIEVSNTGQIVWAKSYGGSGYDELKTVIEMDNGFLAFGNTKSYGEGGSDIFVVRTDEFGNVSGCSNNINLTSRDISLSVNNQSPTFELLTPGDPFSFGVTNTDLEENVICDGCDAADLVAGLYCETAPIICSIDCLDGFTGTLPDEYLLPQPEPLCSGNGFPNNVSWFAFVAGSSTVDLTIIPTNCDTIFNEAGDSPTTIGIQAGIYEDCSFTSSIACQTSGCMNLIVEDINLSSDQFVEGQMYYLFIDGCGGSICDYEVVVNSAQQAFEMDEITTISNNLNLDLLQDTLCQGAELTFTLDNFIQNVNFNWSIDPPTLDYPSGVHPVTDTSSVTFQFSEEGCFDIHVYAFNECDNSETQTLTICVKPLEDEVFSDIYVCQECFPITLISPEMGCIITEGGGVPTVLIEDPNGDGVPGWLGTSTINMPGLDSNLVTNIYGCSYTQYVNVVEIPISPREQVDYYFCLTDFPVDINGFTFNSPGQTRNITLEGAAASGCDSLMSITAHGLDLFGSTSIGNCEAGEVELAFEVSYVVPTNYDSITFTWYDENANIVLDNNGIDSILIAMGIGSYSVQVEVHVGNVSCAQTFGPFMIDVDNLAPEMPTIGYAPLEICVSELQAQIYVTNQGLGENYIWNFTPNMPIGFGLSSDTVYVDIFDGQDFEFCVHAVNGCGTSEEICDEVVVHESPDSEFAYDAEVCIDSFALIEYIGAFGASSSSIFTWGFDGGIILNGMDTNSGGPFEIGFSSIGVYTIGLILSEEGCSSILTEYQVNVVEPFIAPMIECESGAGLVTFSWDDTNVNEVDVIAISGQSSFDLVDNSFIVDGLSSEEEVTIQIVFNEGDACGGVTIIENCTSLPCPEVELELFLSEQNLCLNEDSDVTLSININGDNSGIGIWSSPYIYNDSLFNITDAGVGEHLISYNYEIDDCVYSIDSILSIYDSPTVEIDIFPSYCEEMGSPMIDIIGSMDNSFFLDNELVSEFNNIEVNTGNHTISITGIGGCMTEYNFYIDSIVVENLEILGGTKIVEGESNTYTARYNSNLDDLILTWLLEGDTICVDCIEVEINPNENSELCLLISYGDGCSISDCLLIEIGKRTEIYIPNVFSPNNDNINDIFTIGSNSNNAFINEIMIFDRWGGMVYNQKGFNIGEESRFWDGTFNGQMCVPGVYVYIINYLDEENQVKRISGDLTLVR